MNRRKHIRFNGDDNQLVNITFSSEMGKVEIPALLVNESFSGCSLVITSITSFNKGETVSLIVGKMEIKAAHICWVKELDEHILKLGIEYDDPA